MKLKNKIGMLIEEAYISDEPQHCMRAGCDEMHNGLNRFYTTFGDGFRMEMWLCDKCAIRFRKILRKEIKQLEKAIPPTNEL